MDALRKWVAGRLTALVVGCGLLGCALTAGGCAQPGSQVAASQVASQVADFQAPVSQAPVSQAPTDVGAPAAVQKAVEQTIGAFNATAGGPVASQQAELTGLVSTGQAQVQARCPKATSTIRFEPVYSRLATAPGWKPAGGTLPGVVYALPTLIRIYTGDRITGTDLTDLHVAVDGGRVRLPALCLN